MKLKPGWAELPVFRRRFIYLSICAAVVFLLLILRLWYLQGVRSEYYQQLAEKNRSRFLPVEAPRGYVYDRNGNLLLDNRPAFDIVALRQEVEDPERLFAQLAPLLDLPVPLLRERWARGKKQPRYQPVLLAGDVNRDCVDRVQENSVHLPGVLVEVKPLRAYPYGELASHLFGYLGMISEQELRSAAFVGYRPDALVGRAGLEREFESYLRGIDGERRVEVDVRGRELRILNLVAPVPGNKVFMTIRRDVQQVAEDAFGDQSGAIVALDVRNGEILALASRPPYGPASFARGINAEEWQTLLSNPRHPMQDKALRGQYPPGSTFKPVAALAALQSGSIKADFSVDCKGSFELGPAVYRCWKKEGHGPTDLKKALRESCDVWFYQAGVATGIDQLSKMAFALGLGKELGFALDTERSGLIPTRQWKKRRFNDRWYDGETVIAAIGQGYVLTTPLQLAVMTAAIANGGKVWRPRAVSRVESLDGETLFATEPEMLIDTALDPPALKAVQQGMEAVVNESGGTGWAARLAGIRVAGKTGTAQVVRRKSDEEEERSQGEEIPYQFRDHALFIAYAPAQNPEIAVAVVVEHGEHGGSAAAPIVRAVLASYFSSTGTAPENSHLQPGAQ